MNGESRDPNLAESQECTEHRNMFNQGSVGSDCGFSEEGGAVELDHAALTYLPNLANKSIEQLIHLAGLAEKIENFEDMRIVMREVALRKNILTEQERTLVASAYKNTVGKRRASWRQIYELEQTEMAKVREREKFERCGSEHSILTAEDLENGGIDVPLPVDSRSAPELHGHSPLLIMGRIVREDLEDLCLEFIDLVSRLLEYSQENESTVFYKKLIADYYRYLSEYVDDGARAGFIKEANRFYTEALELASAELLPTNTIRLGLALNVSVFYFEIMNTPDKACELAKTTYDCGVSSLDGVKGSKESLLLLDLLRENLTVWTTAET
uniref:14-3-3 domain-containing protein n=1 Tax=Mucochytrium quahogii TaxID=96639 RepID=A0A7S2WRY7_9STRA